jgi:hypothetical protein
MFIVSWDSAQAIPAAISTAIITAVIIFFISVLLSSFQVSGVSADPGT